MLMIVCIHCRSTTSVKELDEESGFAVCRRCGALFEFPEAHIREAREDHPWLRPPRQLPAPSSYTISTTDTNPMDCRESVKRELAMSWPVDDVRLRRWACTFVTVITWLPTGLVAHEAFQHKGPNLEILLPTTVFCTILSIVTAYLTLLAFLSRAHLTIQKNTLQIRYRPRIPWDSSIMLQADDINQLVCRRHISGRHSEFIHFSLEACLRSGKKLPLIPRMKTAMPAMFLLQRLREALGLPPEAGASVTNLRNEINSMKEVHAQRRANLAGNPK